MPKMNSLSTLLNRLRQTGGAKRWALLAALALLLPAAALATVEQSGNLRVTVLSQVLPFKLPRNEPSPIAVFVSGHIASVDGTTPPQLKRMKIRLNRHG